MKSAGYVREICSSGDFNAIRFSASISFFVDARSTQYCYTLKFRFLVFVYMVATGDFIIFLADNVLEKHCAVRLMVLFLLRIIVISVMFYTICSAFVNKVHNINI